MNDDHSLPADSPEASAIVEALRKRLGWERAEMAAFLGVTSRSYARRLRTGRFDLGQRLKLEMLAVVFDEGTKTLHGEEAASHWLRFHTYSFGGKPAIALLDSIHGFQTVQNMLGRIEYNMLA